MPNQTGIHSLLQGPGGPVYRHVQQFITEAQRLAKVDAPKNTGSLAASTRAVGPSVSATGVEGSITASALNPRTGEDYALAVHQGHRVIKPLTKPALKFYWQGRWTTTQTVRERRGRPFLWNGITAANESLSSGRFKLTLLRPYRKTGS